jgi:hypothetical protein
MIYGTWAARVTTNKANQQAHRMGSRTRQVLSNPEDMGTAVSAIKRSEHYSRGGHIYVMMTRRDRYSKISLGISSFFLPTPSITLSEVYVSVECWTMLDSHLRPAASLMQVTFFHTSS